MLNNSWGLRLTSNVPCFQALYHTSFWRFSSFVFLFFSVCVLLIVFLGSDFSRKRGAFLRHIMCLFYMLQFFRGPRMSIFFSLIPFFVSFFDIANGYRFLLPQVVMNVVFFSFGMLLITIFYWVWLELVSIMQHGTLLVCWTALFAIVKRRAWDRWCVT